MTETLADFVIELFRNKISNELIVFVVSMLPVLELRGGMVAAKLLDLPLLPAFFISFAGNMLPIPFILIFIRKIFQFLRDKKGFSKIIEKLEIRSMRQSDKVKRWREWGLLMFVAIPLPGTGGWTGALIAALIDMRIKKSLPIIAVGVLIAGFIMAVLTYGLPALLGR
ncbi:MAG: small multi-drug export protein [Clostridiales bacterium]|nr:small multi-drug export protein [Clostridiales bacterium]